MLEQRFLEDTAGTIRYTPIEGPPMTSATIELFTPGNAALQASASATMPTVDTTLASAAAAGALTITVASATGVVPGGRYWIGTVGVETPELVQVRSIASAVLTLAEKIQFAHASGQTVKGSELTYALTTTHTADVDQNYRAVWKYTVDSVAQQATQTWAVVKQIFRLDLHPSSLAARIPQALRRATRGVASLSELIDEAENDIMEEIGKRGQRADLVRNPQQFRSCGMIGVERILLNRARMTDPTYREAWRDSEVLWDAEFSRVMERIDWYDRNEDLAAGQADAASGELSEENVAAVRYLPYA